MKIILHVTPMGAVRQNKSDSWRDRPVVLRYRLFRDLLTLEARNKHFTPSEQMRIWFYLPMPPSWSKKKRAEMNGKPHQQKPDRDNLEKAFMDALIPEDCVVWHGEQFKYWTDSQTGYIEVEHIV